MNARIQASSLGLILSELWDPELERNALGAAMLGEQMPAWLESRHFFLSHHATIYETALQVGRNVALVASELRRQGRLYIAKMGQDRHSKPGMLSSVELAAMCLEFTTANRLGWAFDWAEIRQLAEKRELVELMARATIELRYGGAVAGVKAKLCEFFDTEKEQ